MRNENSVSMSWWRRVALACIVLMGLGTIVGSGGGGGDAPGNPADVPPTVTVQPASQVVVAGGGVTFSITATGAAVTYQWQRSTNSGATWAAITGATAASYSLPVVDSSMNAHQFRAILRSGTATTESAVATLTVTPPPPPTITTQPTDQATTVGSSVSFSVVAVGGTLRYQWQASTDMGITWSNVAGATGDTLALTTLALADSGRRLRVTVTNDGGSIDSNVVLLTVTPALTTPVIITQPADAAVAATRTATFTVAASGNPVPTVQWQMSTDGGGVYANISGATSSSYITPTLALTDSGARYRAVASNSQGSTTSNAAVLTVNPGSGPGFTLAALSVGTTTCAGKPDGTALCWGASEDGQVDGTLRFVARSPVQVPSLSGVVELAAGFLHTCAAKSNGTVVCWGRNLSGELGSASDGGASIFAPATVAGITGAQSIVTGYYFTCALRTDGTVACWGRNDSGQLGDGTATNRASPNAVSGLSGVVAISSGNSYTCALRSNGTVACWGLNTAGQLGDGTTTLRRIPTTVPGLSGVVGIAAGALHVCAVKADGAVVCWGTTGGGATGSFAASLSPRAMPGLTNVAALAASDVNTCALRLDGSVLCWGEGQGLGIGPSQSNTINPVAVTGLTDVIAMGGGFANMCAVKSDGSLYCWGSNLYGQIGDGTQTGVNVPKRVVGVTVLLR